MEGGNRRRSGRRRPVRQAQSSLHSETVAALLWLRHGEITAHDLLPWGSNYTFLAKVRHEGVENLAVYKPRRGEAPLWDFPDGTLHRRECAAFVLAESIGWSFVPPTVVRGGPLGVGSLQQYVDADPEANCFTLQEQRADELRRIALFDCVTNNADRKAGHCLLGKDGRIWAIDHGLTFHAEPKLRTVIWDFAGQPIPPNLLLDLSRLLVGLASRGELAQVLEQLLAADEVAALVGRITALLRGRTFPHPHSARSIPWPPV